MMEICSVRNEGHLCRTLPSPNKGLTQMWGCHRPGSPSVARCISVSVYHVRHACVCVYAVLCCDTCEMGEWG